MGISADDALRVMAQASREGIPRAPIARGLVAMDRFQLAADEIRYAPASIDPSSIARLSCSLRDFDYSGEITFDVNDAIGQWMNSMLRPVEYPTVIAISSPGDPAVRDRFLCFQRTKQPSVHLPPFTHTFVPSEPPQRRWWQFWPRPADHWRTYTFAEVKRRRFRRS